MAKWRLCAGLGAPLAGVAAAIAIWLAATAAAQSGPAICPRLDKCGATCRGPQRALLHHVNIFGRDDRRLMTFEERRRLSPVGSIGYRDNHPLGTATIVCAEGADPARTYDLIITAAHIFYNLQGRRRAPRFHYDPGGPGGERVAITDFTVGTTDPYHNFESDWAVALVDRRISDDYGCLRAGSVGEANLETIKSHGGHYLAAGLHSKTKFMMISGFCGPVPKIPGDIAFGHDEFYNIDCDFVKGASGGPLVLVQNNAWEVIGVLVRMVNNVDTHPGDPFDPTFNPNQAVRIASDFKATIEQVARTGQCSRVAIHR